MPAGGNSGGRSAGEGSGRDVIARAQNAADKALARFIKSGTMADQQAMRAARDALTAAHDQYGTATAVSREVSRRIRQENKATAARQDERAALQKIMDSTFASKRTKREAAERLVALGGRS